LRGAGDNLNERIDFRRYTSAYLEAEEDAKRRKVGLRLEPPWEWRQHR
jgi:endonuclease YncB( thermonuclease family)